ncbi:MAG: chemotaxis protein CheW, partial [Firmicutes bacterium]|nr:chemotaxis protein CheW [Bacillota bacterium]
MQLVVFSIAEEEYGIPVDYVDEIIRFSDPTLLPKTPPSVLGVINLRNQVIP